MFYRSYSSYLREKYGQSVYRVSVDAGFSCPNRKAGREDSGCQFCDELGSRAVYLQNENSASKSSLSTPIHDLDFPELYTPEAIVSQIKRAEEFLFGRYAADQFILYFQAYSSTFSKTHILKQIYDHALSVIPFQELIVSTRPDCIDEEKADLLASYIKDDFDVWCELGLQSASNRLLKLMNRGHSVEQFVKSYRMLKQRGVKLAVHLITDYPGEKEEERDATIRLMQELRPDAVKIHNLNIPIGTPLHRQWVANPFPVADMDQHIETLIYYLRRLAPETVIMRMTCDTDQPRLAVPFEKWNKSALIQKMTNKMKKMGAVQGDLFKADRAL